MSYFTIYRNERNTIDPETLTILTLIVVRSGTFLIEIDSDSVWNVSDIERPESDQDCHLINSHQSTWYRRLRVL